MTVTLGVQYCPRCGADLADPRAYVQEFWSGEDQNFFCWCAGCGVTCTVVLSEHVVAYEPEH